MPFGDHVRPASAGDRDAWLAEADGDWGTVGSLVPTRYPMVVRVHPPPAGDDWWDAYRDRIGTIADAGARWTTTPDRAVFAVWEGYGFTTATTWYAGSRSARSLARRRRDDERGNAELAARLAQVPGIDRPHRRYHRLEGPVTAATDITEPGAPGRWQRPDLWWPEDRAWFVGTDVDFWSCYVGGTGDFIRDLTDELAPAVESVTYDQRLAPED